jgi:hypothetical protein
MKQLNSFFGDVILIMYNQLNVIKCIKHKANLIYLFIYKLIVVYLENLNLF